MTLSRKWLLLLILACSLSHAGNYLSVGAAPAILYDAPSFKGGKEFIAPPGMPVEAVFSSGNWMRVRDALGNLSWVEAAALSSNSMLVATADTVVIHKGPSTGSAIELTVSQGVLLKPIDAPTDGWIKVSHAAGQTGYVLASQVWGE